MSSTPPDTPPPNSAPATPIVEVSITAGDRAAEILIIDARFNTVAAGVGYLKAELHPGLYKVRFKAGDRTKDQLVEVTESPLQVTGPTLRFSSPIPLPDTSTNHEYHYYPARDMAKADPTVRAGVGAEIMVFVRDSRHRPELPPAPVAPWAGLTLRQSDGKALLDFQQSSQADIRSGYAGAKLAVDPGVYWLETRGQGATGGILALPIVACQGWCTHVYVDSRESYFRNETSNTDLKAAAPNRIADVAGAAMVMAKLDHGSVLNEEMARLSELARQGLMLNRRTIADSDLEAMTDGKVEYPMLGLYAAHFLLAGMEQRDWIRAALILRNLRTWLSSEHPDVSTLQAVCAARGAGEPVQNRQLWPPLLVPTWSLAEAANIAPPISPDDSSLLRQYRLSGSVWNCLQFGSGDDRPYTEAVKRVLALQHQPNRPASLESLAPAAVLYNEWLTAAFSGQGALRSLQESAPQSSSTLLAHWRSFAPGLRQPNPRHSPFQQAARRLLLDAVSAGDDQEMDLGASLWELGQQFRMSPTAAITSFSKLRADAEAAIQTSKLTLSGKKGEPL